MKNKKLLLSLMLVAVLVVIACAITVTATTADPADLNLRIYGKNLLLEDSIYITYAVPVDGTNGADVKMLFWLSPQSEYTYGTQDYTLSPEAGTVTIGSTECYIFNFRHLAAKQMTMDVYAKVYASVSNGENAQAYYSNLDKYSVLQYAYNMLGKTSTANPDAKTQKLLNSMLEYGAAAQEYFGENTDRLATDTYYQIKVKGTTLPDGATHGLYKSGAQIAISAPETNAAGESFLYWQNSAGAEVSTERSYTITVSGANESYTAIYGEHETPSTDPLIYTELSDGTYSVKANPDVALPAAIAIPATYNNKAVTVIEDSAFLDCTALTNISLPHGITTIGEKAFSGCTGLTALNIPETVTTIGIRAFHDCELIPEITIPASVTNIGTQIFYGCDKLSTVYYNSTYGSQDNPFLAIKSIETVVFGGSRIPSYIAYNCVNLKNVTIYDSVTSIGYSAFYGCSSLTSITIPDSVTTIGSYAFYGCSSLTSITISDSVTSIGNYAFHQCTNIKAVYITDLEAWCKISFGDWRGIQANPMQYGANLYLNNELVTKLEIPKTITKIKPNAFEGCTSFTSITIPDSVTSIGYSAFDGCSSLTSITIPDSVTSIGSGAFLECYKLVEVINHSSLNIVAGSSEYGCVAYYAKEVHTGETKIVNQNGYLFSTYNGINYLLGYVGSDTILALPETYNGQNCEIYQYAFYGCSSLTSITISDSVTSIGNYAFFHCSSLTSITIPDSVTSIGHSAFLDCSSLTSITIPDSVTSIDDFTFLNCSSLKTVYYNGTAEDWVTTSIGSYNDALTSATIYYFSETQPTTEGNYWHYVDDVPTAWPTYTEPELNYLTFTLMENDTYSVKANPDVELPPAIIIPAIYKGTVVTAIEDNAFKDCAILTSITIPDSVTSIGKCAFENCSALTNIILPDSVTSIAPWTFYECTNLISITISGNVTSIEMGALSGCTALNAVYYVGKVDNWKKITIGSYNTKLITTPCYYYSEIQPTSSGNYWRYVDGVPTAW